MKIIELFSGIGGFAKGFEEAGYHFEEHYFSEIDKHAIANYKYNFPNAKHIGSVTDIPNGNFTGIDLITGGFPCQPFSIAGKRQGFEDTRGTLFFEIVRICKEIQPKYLLLENVKGLLNHDNGRTFSIIYQTLTDIGYTVEFQLVNTKWFLPQNRERIYLVGHLATTQRSFQPIFPIGENEEIFNRATRQKSRECSNKETTHSRTITSRMHKMGSDDTYIKAPTIARTLTGGGNSGGLHSDMTTIQVGTWREFQGEEGIRPMKDNICSTLLARARKDGSGQPVVSDKTNIRRLTEIECERLQGFPDNWTKYGDFNGEIKEISATQRYKMIGNAVSVPIVKEIAKRLKQ